MVFQLRRKRNWIITFLPGHAKQNLTSCGLQPFLQCFVKKDCQLAVQYIFHWITVWGVSEKTLRSMIFSMFKVFLRFPITLFASDNMLTKYQHDPSSRAKKSQSRRKKWLCLVSFTYQRAKADFRDEISTSVRHWTASLPFHTMKSRRRRCITSSFKSTPLET